MARRLLLVAALGMPGVLGAAQNDPFYARVRGLADVPYASYQGYDCATIPAPRELVFRILASPDRASEILLAGLPNVLPRTARYRKERTAAKGEVLVLAADTVAGRRQVELNVLAILPGHLLSFGVVKDEQLLAFDVTQLSDTFFLESNPDGSTDVYWANHYDASSPFAAALGPLRGAPRFRARREAGLLALEGLARAAAAIRGGPPLPDVPVK